MAHMKGNMALTKGNMALRHVRNSQMKHCRMIKLFVHFFNFSDPKNNMILTFLSTGHSVRICIYSRWDTKKNWSIVIKVFEMCTGETK